MHQGPQAGGDYLNELGDAWCGSISNLADRWVMSATINVI